METESNGHAAERPGIKFGPLDNQVVSAEWAETMLRELFARSKPQFGRLLVIAAGAGRDVRK